MTGSMSRKGNRWDTRSGMALHTRSDLTHAGMGEVNAPT